MKPVGSYRKTWEESQKPGGEQNFFDYFIYRRISTFLLLPLRETRFSPNWITSASILFSIFAGWTYFLATELAVLQLGVVFMILSLVLDTMDGQYSRLTGQQSDFGAWYDGVSDSLKYVILFLGLSCGAYYHLDLDTQWLLSTQWLENRRELFLLAGMLIIGNLFMVYYVHVSRYALPFNPGKMVETGGSERRFHFGIESTLYTLFTLFLLVGQVVWLFGFLVVTLPALWILPMYRVYRHSLSADDV